MELKFTQEIKDKWLAELKSGKYKQGFVKLHNVEDDSYCCIGVLAACTDGLEIEYVRDNRNPYNFLEFTIGDRLMTSIYHTNDTDIDNADYPRDYSNVIPLIEALPLSE